MDEHQSGPVLQAARIVIRPRITQEQLATAMGLSVSRVRQIEREAFVSAALAERYRNALEACRLRRAA